MRNKIQAITKARDLSREFKGRKVFVHTEANGYNIRFDSPIETTEDFKNGLIKESRTVGFALRDVWSAQ
jgi:hypothetical protein